MTVRRAVRPYPGHLIQRSRCLSNPACPLMMTLIKIWDFSCKTKTPEVSPQVVTFDFKTRSSPSKSQTTPSPRCPRGSPAPPITPCLPRAIRRSTASLGLERGVLPSLEAVNCNGAGAANGGNYDHRGEEGAGTQCSTGTYFRVLWRTLYCFEVISC
jgi:hypothetical protein